MCQSDLSVTKEISDNPNQRPGPMAKVTVYSILFIEQPDYKKRKLICIAFCLLL